MGGLGPLSPPFIADLSAQELEAKVIAALLVLSDDGPTPIPVVIPEVKIITPLEEPREVVEIEDLATIPGRRPRVILLTDTKRCSPCVLMDRTIVNVLKQDNFKSAGWTVGRDNINTLEVVDINKDKEKFWEYSTLLSNSNLNYNSTIPVFVRVNKKGVIDKISGPMTLEQFITFSTKFEE